MTNFRPLDHPRDGDGTFISKPTVGVHAGIIAALADTPTDAADNDIEQVAWLLAAQRMDPQTMELMKEAGVTAAEALDALDRGIDRWAHPSARKAGASHDQVLEAKANTVGDTPGREGLYTYAEALEHRSTHAEIMEAHHAGMDCRGYVEVIDVATHAETLDAHQRGWNRNDYWYARDAGVNHEEFGQIIANGLNSWDYVQVREAGTSHENAMLRFARASTPTRRTAPLNRS
jgi:hypothetical protein